MDGRHGQKLALALFFFKDFTFYTFTSLCINCNRPFFIFFFHDDLQYADNIPIRILTMLPFCMGVFFTIVHVWSANMYFSTIFQPSCV